MSWSCVSKIQSGLLPQDANAEKVGYQNINHCHCLLVRDGVNLRPLCEQVHGDQMVLFPSGFEESMLQC